MNTIHIINGSDRAFFSNRYVLARTCGAWTVGLYMVWASDLDSAFDELGDWLEENEPGAFCDELVSETVMEALADGLSEEEAWSAGYEGVMRIGNYGRPVESECMHVVLDEGASREDVLRLMDRVA